MQTPALDFNQPIALFLDVDGTLLEFCNNPDDVYPGVELNLILKSLSSLLKGALALVTGRRVLEIDRIFHPLQLPVGGQHGLEHRDAEGNFKLVKNLKFPENIRSQIQCFGEIYPECAIEDKTLTMAIHYRRAPKLEEKVLKFVNKLIEGEKHFHAISGNMVIEIKPLGVDKGQSIALFMENEPFVDKLPIFIGDDVTDEDGFRYINANNGISIKVGTITSSLARYNLNNVNAVHDWLGSLCKEMGN
jgi:trehalose 6-phosphate phosphatase